MKMPKFLLGFSLLFWGWQTQWWIIALPMALIYETSHFISWRWNFSPSDFKQINKFCTFIAIALLVYLYITNRSIYLIFSFFKFLPLIFFPLLIAQIYSTSRTINISTLFLFISKTKKQSKKIALSYPYFIICLISASVGNTRDLSFYLGMFILSSIALWFIRSPGFSPILWICLLLIAGSVGFAGSMALQSLQTTIEKNTAQWLENFYESDVNPLQRSTAIGDIGSIKLSNKIILRLKSDSGQIEPQLLKRATYNKYGGGMWAAVNSEFEPLQPEANSIDWHLAQEYGKSSTISISTYLKQNPQLLNIPNGTLQINQLSVETMAKNQYGTIKVEGESGILSYQVKFLPRRNVIDNPPTEEDLQIPESETPALNTIVNQLELTKKSPQEIVNAIEKFFGQNFTYSLELATQNNNSTPLSAFLLDHRSGHCEYFATATTLLLRMAGIPSRYAIGYSVHEFSPLENQFIVRQRNAHAWTMVYINDTWQILDITPSSWIAMEDANASNWQFISDFFSWFWFKIAQIFQYLGNATILKYLIWLTIPLIIFVLIRWLYYRTKNIKREKILTTKTASKYIPLGQDSEFYLIEKTLNESGLTREDGETFKQWIERLKENLPTSDLIDELQSIIRLHYRYRFDPQGIKTTERKQLKSSCESWLSRYNHQKSSQININ